MVNGAGSIKQPRKAVTDGADFILEDLHVHSAGNAINGGKQGSSVLRSSTTTASWIGVRVVCSGAAYASHR